jgi:hypothetical protein
MWKDLERGELRTVDAHGLGGERRRATCVVDRELPRGAFVLGVALAGRRA